MMDYALMRDETPIPTSKDLPALESWFHPATDPSAAYQALTGIQNWVRQAFNKGAALLKTPGMTGTEMVRYKLPFGAKYRPMPLADRAFIKATYTQGRIETFSPDPATVCFDGRATYLAYCSRVPVYDPADYVRDTDPTFVPYRPGRYRVAVTVPAGWAHVGLVHAAGPTYPRTPGEEFEAWLTEFEIRHLLQKHAWQFAIRERMLFSAATTAFRDPLTPWATPFREMLGRIESHPQWGTAAHLRLIRDGIRAIGLHAIGRFAHPSDIKTLKAFNPQTWPESLRNTPGAVLNYSYDGQYELSIPRAASIFESRFDHPEWAEHIWAVCRTRVTERMLMVPFNTIVNVATDGIRLTADPGWADETQVGGYRRKPVNNG